MAEQCSAPCLNSLIVAVGRSFLQYLGESWPWVDEATIEKRKSLLELVGRQKCDVAALVNAQISAGHELTFGAFPTEYTDLHYIDLSYLLAELISNQRAVVRCLEESACAENAVVAEVLSNERSILTDIEAMQSESGKFVA